MTPQHTGARPDDPTTWGAADMETCQNLAAIHANEQRKRTERRNARRARRAAYLHRVRHVLHLAA